MAEGRDEQRRWDALQIYFDFFKHFTTLATGTGLVMVALYGALDLKSQAAAIGLVTMAVTLFLSIIGLLVTLHLVDVAAYWPRFEGPGSFSTFLAIAVVSTFLTGVLFFGAVAATGAQPQFPTPF